MQLNISNVEICLNTLYTVCFMHGLSIYNYEIKMICHRAYFFHNLIWKFFSI